MSLSNLPAGTFVQVNAQGLLEVIDEKTGALVAIEKVNRQEETSLKEHTLPDGTIVLVDERIDPKTLKVVSKNAYVFNSGIASLICQFLTEGKSFDEICRMEGMPPLFILHKWRKMYKDFDEALEQSLRDKAYMFIDKAIQKIEQATVRGEPDYKSQSEMYLKFAEKANPDRFGNRVKHSGDKDSPMSWTIVTGVPQKLPESEPVRILQNEELPALEGKHD